MNKTILLLSLLLGASTISAQSTQCTGIALSTEVRCLNKTLNLDSERCHHHANAMHYSYVTTEVEETGFQFTGWFDPLAIYCYFMLQGIVWALFYGKLYGLLQSSTLGIKTQKGILFLYNLVNGIGITFTALSFLYYLLSNANSISY